MTTNPKIKALAPWAGSKRTLAPRIVELLGDHTGYFEPFFGGGAVLFAKPPCRHEVVNDLNGDLTNLCWVLQDSKLKRRLLAKLHDTLCSESLYTWNRIQFLEPFKACPRNPNLTRAYQALVAWWLGRNGTAGTKGYNQNFCARFSTKGGSGGVRFASMLESLPWLMDRLRRVDVLNRNAFEVIEDIQDQAGTVIYVDPPYVKKSFKYEHDFTEDDHRRLAAVLHRFKRAKVVLSYYPHRLLDGLYEQDHWDRHATLVAKNMANTGKHAAMKMTELLYVSKCEG
jgi:DNA adenine methylase